MANKNKGNDHWDDLASLLGFPKKEEMEDAEDNSPPSSEAPSEDTEAVESSERSVDPAFSADPLSSAEKDHWPGDSSEERSLVPAFTEEKSPAAKKGPEDRDDESSERPKRRRTQRRTKTTKKTSTKVKSESISSPDPWSKLADQLGIVSERKEAFISVMKEEVFEENTSYDESGLRGGDEPIGENLRSRQESTELFLPSNESERSPSDYGETTDIVVSFREGKEDLDEAWVVRDDPNEEKLYGSSDSERESPSPDATAESSPPRPKRKGRGRRSQGRGRGHKKAGIDAEQQEKKKDSPRRDDRAATAKDKKEKEKPTTADLGGFGVGIFSEDDPNGPSGTPKVDFDDLNEQYSVSEQERQEDEQPPTRKPKRGRRRSKRAKKEEPSVSEEVAESSKKGTKAKPVHKNIPSWNEAISAVIEENIANRGNRKRESRHRGRRR